MKSFVSSFKEASTIIAQSSSSPLYRSYGADNKQGVNDKELKPMQFALQIQEGIALGSIAANRTGFTLLSAASTERPKAVGEMRRSIKATR
jgi:hypothetical protein